MSAPGRVLVAMSGGVDSSLAAALLCEEGHAVVGVTMKTFCYGDAPTPATRTCCGLDGIQDARRVADRLGIPHYVFDVEEHFTRDVIDDFVAEYARGRTPNPCVRCNSYTKFRDLAARGTALGCDTIATGHYVRCVPGDGEPHLLRGVDRDKDQAYFLWGLPREVLGRLRFPLGSWTKAEVRTAARERGLETADKPESQEICFVPTGDYRDLLRQRLEPTHPALRPGRIVTTDGQAVGQHTGYAGFTVGQRRGLGGGFPSRMYVVAVDSDSGDVVVGTRADLEQTSVEIDGLHWLTGDPPGDDARVSVQVRHRARALAGRLTWAGARCRVLLDAPTAAVTPGQSAVLFLGDRVLGGGRIRTPSDDPSDSAPEEVAGTAPTSGHGLRHA